MSFNRLVDGGKSKTLLPSVTMFAIITLLLATCVYSGQVVQLNDTNLQDTIRQNKYVMVKFYAPWCTHCKSMAEDYIKLAKLIEDNGVVIAEVQATQNNVSAAKYGVEGYPAIKLFVDGTPIDYKGQRSTDAMYGWIKTTSEKVLETINDVKVQEKIGGKANFVVYQGTDAAKVKTIFLLNLVDQSTQYYHNPDSSSQTLALYPTKLSSQQSKFLQYPSTEAFEVEAIKKWVIMNTIPTVVPISSEQYLNWVFYNQGNTEVGGPTDVALLLREIDLTEAAYARFEKICEIGKTQKLFKCGVVTKQMDIHGGVQGYLKSTGQSVLALVRKQLQQAYSYTNPLDELSINENKHKNLAEAEQPQPITYQNVVSLTDQNFDAYIKENQVVFVEFYGHTCPHCVEFAPKYDQFAKSVKENNEELKDVKIAACDLPVNRELGEKVDVENFPSFILYIQGEPIPYEGARNPDEFLNFIKNARTQAIIEAGSIAEIPAQAVIIYDSSQKTVLNKLPALFTRLPIYRLKEGTQVKIVLRIDQEHTYPPAQSTPQQSPITLSAVSNWLHVQTDPVLMNLLNANMDKKLMKALHTKTPIVGYIDINPQTSQVNTKVLQQFCKGSTDIACGTAEKADSDFGHFVKWIGIEETAKDSFLIMINTQNFDKYVYNNGEQKLLLKSSEITQWIQDIKDKKVEKFVGSEPKIQTEQVKTPEGQAKTQGQDAKSDQTSQSGTAQTEGAEGQL